MNPKNDVRQPCGLEQVIALYKREFGLRWLEAFSAKVSIVLSLSGPALVEGLNVGDDLSQLLVDHADVRIGVPPSLD